MIAQYAAKIHVTGGVWLPPEGWESPQEAAARLAEMLAGTLCDCGKDIVRWQKHVRFPNPHAILMCDGCKKYEVELYGPSRIEPYQPPP